MAFCTVCGAQVNGAFCNQCGTPANVPGGQPAAGQAPPPQPMSPPPMGPPPPVGMPPMQTKKTSPLVWILAIVLGLFVLGGLAAIGMGFFVYHKVKQAGIDPALMQKNPGLAVSKMITAFNPDAEVVRTDEDAGTITIRDKKTDKVFTLTFDQVKNGQFKMVAEGDDGKQATIEVGAGANSKLPSWVPTYPGSSAQGTFSVKGDGGDGEGEGGSYAFTTKDAPSKALAFYQDKAKEMGMKVNMTATGDQGGLVSATDEASKRTMTVMVGGDSNETTVNVTYAQKR